MSSSPQPTWRPISWLPDEATLARARRVFSEQAEDVELYAEQLRRRLAR
jgi:hypothetical protein